MSARLAPPLSWVKPEVDHALKIVRESIAQAMDGDGAPAALGKCPAQLHQVTGALNILGLTGVVGFCESIEKALQQIAGNPAVPKTAVAALDRAVLALKEFIDGLAKGEANAPIRLFPVYREVSSLHGKADVTEKDLFFPDLTLAPPLHPAARAVPDDRLAAAITGQRTHFQRGLLPLLRGTQTAEQLKEMRKALEVLDAISAQLPPPRSLWWAATAVFDGLLMDKESASWVTAAKSLCGKLDLCMRDTAHGQPKAGDVLLRDVLYAVAKCKGMSKRIREVRVLFQLDSLFPEPDMPGLLEFDMDNLEPALDELRGRVQAIKDFWVRTVTGEDAATQQLKEAVAALRTRSNELGNMQLVRMVDAVTTVIAKLPSPYPRDRQPMVTEMAGAFLLIENILNHFVDTPADLAHQVDIMGGWLLDAANGRGDGAIPEGLREDLSEEVSKTKLRTQVAREIGENLTHVEQVLDAYTRDPSKLPTLPAILPLLKQIHGALNILGFDRAAEIQSQCNRLLARCTDSEARWTADEMDTIVDGLSSIGFYLDPCVRGLPPADAALDSYFDHQARRAAPRPSSPPVLRVVGRDASEPAAVTPAPAPSIEEPLAIPPVATGEEATAMPAGPTGKFDSPPQANSEIPVATAELSADTAGLALTADTPAPIALVAIVKETPADATPLTTTDTPADDSRDELLGIFLEEAQEVLTTIRENLQACRADGPHDEALTTLRRGFHTLKGSGRMVGLNEIGEAAWEVEQVMNRWLEKLWPPTKPLLDMLDAAEAWFTEQVAALSGQAPAATSTPDSFVRQATALKTAEWKPENTVAEDTAAAVNPPADDQPDEVTELTAVPQDTVIIGPLQITNTLYQLYCKEAAQHLDTLRKFSTDRALSSDDKDAFVIAAHTLTGISRTAGFPAVADIALRIEQLAPWIPANMDATDSATFMQALQSLESMVSDIDDKRFPAADSPVSHALDSLLPRWRDARQPAPQPEPEIANIPPSSTAASAAPLDEPVSAAGHDTPAVPAPPAMEPVIELVDDQELVKAAAMQQRADQRGIRDDLDPELLPIFLEEADTLVPSIARHLRQWQSGESDPQTLLSLKRALHTLKGSARMAGAMRLGELTHLVESGVESCGEALPDTAASEKLSEQVDRIATSIERMRLGDAEPVTAAGAVPPAADHAGTNAAAAPLPADMPAGDAFLRVPADAIDRFINDSGEIGVARTRIEDETRACRQILVEFNESVMRLRAQLRELEVQADSQMQSRRSVLASEMADFDPLEFDRYTRLQELTRLATETLHDMANVHQSLGRHLSDTESATAFQSRVTRGLQQGLMHTRTVPFNHLEERLYRIVRQTSRELGKKVNLEIVNGHIQLDRSVLERFVGPLEHLLRNAIAHGIEAPEMRAAKGKEETGEIRLVLRQDNNEISLTVSDDGGGVPRERLRAKAVAVGLLNAQQNSGWSDEWLDLIFQPGLSTAETVSEIAGRGIGLDVVRSEIGAMGGHISVASSLETGTQFGIVIPLSLAVTQAVLVRGGDMTVAIPSASVEQVLRLKPEEMAAVRQAGQLRVRQQDYALHTLSALLGIPGNEHAGYQSVLMLRSGAQKIALHVDELLKNQEIIVKGINAQLARAPGVTGATVLANGKVVLIMNPVQLSLRTGSAPAPVPATRSPEADSRPLVLVVDDSLTVRKITSRLLEREGYRVDTAKDGVDAIEKMQTSLPHIMLVDIEMPRMDGFDLVRQVRADNRSADVPVIMISSRTAEKHRTHATELGVNAFFGKPYQDTELLREMQSLLKPAGAAVH